MSARDDYSNADERGDLIDRLVSINRVAKVVKGGRRFGFAALSVVGDGRGRIGYGSGKAREVPEAVRKATEQAKRSMIRIPLREGRTLHHDLVGRFRAGHVVLRAAPPGTGIIAGGAMRAVFEALGAQDVVCKSVRSSNPYNMVKATFAALRQMESPRDVAARRGIKTSQLGLARRKMAENTDKDEVIEKADAPAKPPTKTTAKGPAKPVKGPAKTAAQGPVKDEVSEKNAEKPAAKPTDKAEPTKTESASPEPKKTESVKPESKKTEPTLEKQAEPAIDKADTVEKTDEA